MKDLGKWLNLGQLSSIRFHIAHIDEDMEAPNIDLEGLEKRRAGEVSLNIHIELEILCFIKGQLDED